MTFCTHLYGDKKTNNIHEKCMKHNHNNTLHFTIENDWSTTNLRNDNNKKTGLFSYQNPLILTIPIQNFLIDKVNNNSKGLAPTKIIAE